MRRRLLIFFAFFLILRAETTADIKMALATRVVYDSFLLQDHFKKVQKPLERCL